jgi:hypothetical protein
LLFCVIGAALGAVGFIKDTKSQNCMNGNCENVCLFENLKLAPGSEEVNDGKCRKIQCHQDFSVTVRQ